MKYENWALAELPKTWLWTDFESISRELKAGGTPLTRTKEYYDGGKIPFVKIEDIVGSSKYLYDTKTRITEQGLRNSSAWLVPRDSLLYSMYASYGEPIINKIEVATSQAIIAYIHPQDLIVLDYVYYYLKKIRAELTTRGTTQKNLNGQIVRRIPIPLAPFNEQLRIVARLEELFTRLDAGVEGMRRVKVQLRRYRKAVLKNAFEGKLTEEWRKTHKEQIEPAQNLLARIRQRRKVNDKLESTQPINTSEFIPPESWVVTSLDELSDQIVDCLHSTPKFTIEGKYCVDTNCIEPNKILFQDARFVSEKTFEDRIRRLKPRANDVLFAREGTIGTAVTVPENVDVCLGQRMMMFRPDEEINSHYFSWGLMSPFFEKQWKAKVAGSTVAHINIRDIRKMVLPLPSVEEQRILVEEVERCMSLADDVDRNLDQSFLRSELMRLSILRDAFEGKLVPQNPDDEPAEKLLERIETEHLGKNGLSKGKKQFELSHYVK